MPTRGSLFDADLPAGFLYRDDFLTPEGESGLITSIGELEFSTFEMRGVAARRRVAFFGSTYDAARSEAAPIPSFLLPVREQVAAFAGVEPGAFAMALINEYPPGAPIGWHRDAPQYGIVAGISLVSSCRMAFRPYVSPAVQRSAGSRRTTTHQITLERRSAYLLAGESRSAYEHHIPAVAQLRYSITFRTIRS